MDKNAFSAGDLRDSASVVSPFIEPAERVLRALGSTRHGLGAAEAGRRLAAVGANVLPETPPPSAFTVFVRQFASPFIYVLLLAAGLALLLKEWADAGFIGVVVVLNAAIGTLQEARAERSAHALRQMMTTTARVVRDGDLAEVDAAELVPGDIVVLASGDKVPADLRLLDGQDLQIDESLLTGESLPVVKDARAVLPADAALAERTNMAFAGAFVNRGRGEGVVVATGLSVQIGVLASELAATAQQEPPLVMRMRRFTHWVAAVMVVVAATFAALEAARGTRLSQVALIAIALAVSAIPEGLPVALTVALAIATRKMAQRHVIVRRMAAVEALGSCTTIATDKTGTVTVNELTATDVVLPGGSLWRVTGAGAAPEGELIPAQSGDAVRRDDVVALARAGALCNEAALIRGDSNWATHGDAVDASLLVLAHKLGITRADALAEAPQVAHLPFESDPDIAAK
ncbi:MAG: HAD-IC family P-type ATPase [Actinomycetota bacterium]|nr:HAD-IC family P-type ATPase [Actinomycetota bacterium]